LGSTIGKPQRYSLPRELAREGWPSRVKPLSEPFGEGKSRSVRCPGSNKTFGTLLQVVEEWSNVFPAVCVQNV
jgi:hypothetical protein